MGYAADYGMDTEYNQPRLVSYLPSYASAYIFSERPWLYSYAFWAFVLIFVELSQVHVPVKIVAGQEGVVCDQLLAYSPEWVYQNQHPVDLQNQTEISEYPPIGCSCDHRILETLASSILLINRIYALYGILVILIGCWICRNSMLLAGGDSIKVHSILLFSILVYCLVMGRLISGGLLDIFFFVWCGLQLVVQLYASSCSVSAQNYRDSIY